MNIKSIILSAVVAISSSIGTAQATPALTWNVQGVIMGGEDNLNLFGLKGTWMGGYQFTKTFTVSIDPNRYSYASHDSYYGCNSGYTLSGFSAAPFTMSVTVNGITVTETFRAGLSSRQYLNNGGTLVNDCYDELSSYQSGIDTNNNAVSSSDVVTGGMGPIPVLDFNRNFSANHTSAVYIQSNFVVGGDGVTWSPDATYFDGNSNMAYYYNHPYVVDIIASDIPEPASIALVGLALSGMLLIRRRKV